MNVLTQLAGETFGPLAITLGAILTKSVWLFFIVDPPGNLPVFLALTKNDTPQDRRYMFRMSSLISCAGVLVLSVTSEFVLRTIFHIHMGAFEIAGGLLTLLVAIRVIMSGNQDAHASNDYILNQSKSHKEALISRAVCPLACPLMFGPAAIVAGTTIVSQLGFTAGIISILLTFAVTYLFLDYAHLLSRVLGKVGHIILERVMMVFVAAIGIQLIFHGIRSLIPEIMKAINQSS